MEMKFAIVDLSPEERRTLALERIGTIMGIPEEYAARLGEHGQGVVNAVHDTVNVIADTENRWDCTGVLKSIQITDTDVRMNFEAEFETNGSCSIEVRVTPKK